ncbi:MAG TPA: hypothetical protein VHV10_02580 [Ktedonobacteraceae bacterium]|nr:hypothetical protein [Ktedonobacteraceae bacterium]
MPHTGIVTPESKIVSKWGPQGVYKHPASVRIQSRQQAGETNERPRYVYGEAWTIYQSDRPGGRYIQKIGLEDSPVMRILSTLRENDSHAIASLHCQLVPTSERLQEKDIILYWGRSLTLMIGP